MANKNFKARIGIEAPLIASDGGTTAITLSGADVTVVGDLTVSGTTTTLDTQNLLVEDKNIIIGNVAVPSDLTADGGGITLKGATDKTFTWLDSNDSWNFNQNIVTTGNVVALGILDVQGGTITDTTGALQITTASNGDLTLAPNGYGNVVTTRNYIKGAIRNSPTQLNGDIFSFSAAGTGGPTRGLSIDNSIDTTKRPGIVLRAYGGGLGSGNPVAAFITETARGSAATPTGLSSGNGLGSFIAGGYADTSVSGTGAGWVSDTTGNTAASLTFQTTEAWTGGSGAGSPLGTRVRISTNPTGSANAIQTSLEINPQSTLHRSDAFTWSNGKTGTTQTMALNVSGQLTVNGNITTLGTGTFNNELAVNAISELLNTNTSSGTTVGIQTNYRPSSGSATYSLPQTGWQLGNFRFNSYNTTGGAYALAGQVTSSATENWTGSANGSSINFFATKQGTTYTTGLIGVISASPETTIFKSDLLTIQNSASVNLVGGKIVYGRQYIEAYSTADQTNPTANAENLMSFNNTGISNGISIVTNGTTLTRITFANAGVYNLQFSAQLSQTSGGSANAFIWLKKNGANVANTAGDTRVAGNGDRIMAAWNYVFSAAAGDYYELAWSAGDTSVILDYSAASAPVPAVPSVILTVVPVGA